MRVGEGDMCSRGRKRHAGGREYGCCGLAGVNQEKGVNGERKREEGEGSVLNKGRASTA